MFTSSRGIRRHCTCATDLSQKRILRDLSHIVRKSNLVVVGYPPPKEPCILVND